MSNASHQPDSMTNLVTDMLDAIINRRDHVAIDFKTIARDTAYDEKE